MLEYDQQQQLLQQQQQQQRWLQDGREGEEEDENEEGEGEGGGGDGHTSRLTNPGTFCEFIIFFLGTIISWVWVWSNNHSFLFSLSLPSCSAVTAIFSVVGFIFAFCLAASVAGQSGAVAGLGIAFVSKPIIFEVSKVALALTSCTLRTCGVCTHTNCLHNIWVGGFHSYSPSKYFPIAYNKHAHYTHTHTLIAESFIYD